MEVSYEVAQISLLVLDTDKTGGVNAIRSYLQDANGFPKEGSDEEVRGYLLGITRKLNEIILDYGKETPTFVPNDVGETIQEICSKTGFISVCERLQPTPYDYLIKLSDVYSGSNSRSPFSQGKQVKRDLNENITKIRDGYSKGPEQGKIALNEVLNDISVKYPRRQTQSLKDKQLEFMGIAMKYCIALLMETEQPITNKNAMDGWLRSRLKELLDLSMGGSLPATSRKTLKKYR